MTVYSLLKKSLSPALWVNLTLMIAAGGFLVSQGFTGNVWPSIVALIASTMLFPIIMLPAGIFAGLMRVFEQAKPFMSKCFGVASMTYLGTILGCYMALSFYMMGPILGRPDLMSMGIIYAIAAGFTPWAIFATKDRDNVIFTGLVLMMETTGLIIAARLIIDRAIGVGELYLYAIGSMLCMLALQALCERLFGDKTPLPPAETPPAP